MTDKIRSSKALQPKALRPSRSQKRIIFDKTYFSCNETGLEQIWSNTSLEA